LKKLAASGANVVCAPPQKGIWATVFQNEGLRESGGHWSIGTDSHIGLNPLEELRMLDYRQRLITNHRNTFDGDAARYLIREEIESGRKAMA